MEEVFNFELVYGVFKVSNPHVLNTFMLCGSFSDFSPSFCLILEGLVQKTNMFYLGTFPKVKFKKIKQVWSELCQAHAHVWLCMDTSWLPNKLSSDFCLISQFRDCLIFHVCT